MIGKTVQHRPATWAALKVRPEAGDVPKRE
jgi:hypothetical protein